MNPFFLVIAFVILLVVPLFLICRKTGLDGWLSLIAIIPFVGPAALAVILARSRWPAVD